MLGGWQEQLILTLTSEDGVLRITHTLDGVLRKPTTLKSVAQPKSRTGEAGTDAFTTRAEAAHITGGVVRAK